MAKGRKQSGRRRPPKTRRKEHGAVVGTLHVTRPGVAEVQTAEGSFPVARGGLREAMNGDTVGVSLSPGPHGVKLARVQHVMERAVTTFLGIYEAIPPLGGVMPLDERIRRDFFVLPGDHSAQELGIDTGDVVQARILTYPARGEAGVVTLVARVGSETEVDVAIETVIANHDLPIAFPDAVLEECGQVTAGVAEALAQDPLRRDLRDLPLMTIDPATARDFDDAVYARRTPEGYELTVAIADVTHYVAPNSSTDNEAKARTCSVYLPDRVLPMLPEALSNDVCSLNPGQDRLAMCVAIELGKDGAVRSSESFPAAIRSKARLDYDAVDRFLAAPKDQSAFMLAEALGAHVSEGEAPQGAEAVTLGQALEALDELAQKRLALREKRGAIDFDSAESKVLLDEDGNPVGVSVRSRTRATGLVEEAMLLANECVAAELASRDVKSAFRVHEPPAPEDLANVVPVLRELDLVGNREAEAVVACDPFAIEAVLRRAHGTTAELLVSTLLLRAMKRAIYLPHNDGHYALGAKAYCHFTSPIRRYPDVIVHRTLKAYWHRRLDAPEHRALDKHLSQLCRQCSEGERRAAGAERDAQAIKMAELYTGRIGAVEQGVVVGCERFGLFVRIDDTGAEGLLPVRELGREWFTYDERRLTLKGEESGTVWRLGDPVSVRVEGTDSPKGRIDFVLAEE